MVQIELAKIRHGKVTGVVTGAIVNVKPDTILPWGVKPNGKVIAVGGDEWKRIPPCVSNMTMRRLNLS